MDDLRAKCRPDGASTSRAELSVRRDAMTLGSMQIVTFRSQVAFPDD
jgi:hypothetical protein